MKTTDPRDPLDQKIDELFTSQPIQAPKNFAERTLAEAIAKAPQRKASGGLAPLIRFALPLAAAVTLAFIVFSQFNADNSEAPTQATGVAATDAQSGEELNNYEVQEILMLQEGLSGFAQIESEELDSGDLLDTLETLYSI